jgi:hypothetical protein
MKGLERESVTPEMRGEEILAADARRSTLIRKTKGCVLGLTGPPLNDVRAALCQKCTQHGPVAAVLVLAVATQRQIRVMRQGRQYIQFAAPIRCVHLPLELPDEGSPLPLAGHMQGFVHKPGAGGQVREPDVVVIEPGEIRLRNAARRPPHGAQP